MRRMNAALACLPFLVAAPVATHAAIFNVNPGPVGLQLAVDIARNQPGSHEIRLRSGTHGPASLPSLTNSIAISGGWNASFTQRSTDATLTRIDGNDASIGLRVDTTAAGSQLVVEGLTITHGFSTEPLVGAAVHVIGVNGEVRLDNLRLVANRHLDGNGQQSGPGGASFRTLPGGHLVLSNSTISNNVVSSVSFDAPRRCFAGALFASAEGGTLEIRSNAVRANQIAATCKSSEGTAAWLSAFGSGLVFEDNLVRGNLSNGPGGAVIQVLAADATGSVTLRRNRLLDNRLVGGTLPLRHVVLHASDGARILLTDSLLAASPTLGGGVLISNATGGILRLTNNTIADHQNLGVHLCNTGGNVSLANSIVSGNGTEVTVCGGSAPANQVANFIGGNPRFRNPAQLDYRLKPNSAAINSGSNNPPGGLGPLDLARTARKKGPKVDRGAYELP